MTGSTGATTDGRATPTGGPAVRAVPAALRPLTTALRWGPLVALAAGWAVWCARAAARPSGVSWHWFAEGSRQLLAEGTSVYAQHPDLQVGPLTLLVVAGARAVAGAHALGLLQVLSTACLAVVAWALLRLLGPAPSASRVAGALAGWLVLAPAWAVLAVRWVHPDDVLALTLLAALVAVVARPGRWSGEVAALAVVLAVAAKPWAVVGVPLLLVLPRARWRAVVLAVVGVAAVWLPFLLAAHGTTGALAPPVRVSDTSVLWWLGLHDRGVVPGWVRPVQLVGAPALALLAVLRGRWAGALLAGLALRFLVDPQHLGYYAAGAVLVALVADLGSRRRWVPWRALVTAAVVWQPFTSDYATRLTATSGPDHWWFAHPGLVAWAGGAWAVLAVVDALAWLPRTPGPDLRPPTFDDRLAATPPAS